MSVSILLKASWVWKKNDCVTCNLRVMSTLIPVLIAKEINTLACDYTALDVYVLNNTAHALLHSYLLHMRALVRKSYNTELVYSIASRLFYYIANLK
jgi:hypothetical protein